MPRYDYECDQCGHAFELRQSFDAEPWGACPRCEGRSKRKFHPVPIIFKGSGFYTTDYAHKNFSAVANREEGGSKAKSEPADGSKAKTEPVKASKNGADGEKSTSSESEKSSASKDKAGAARDKAGAAKEA